MAEKPPIVPLPEGMSLRPGIPPRQEMLIGRVCVHWSMFEGALQDILWQMLGVPIEDGRILTANTDASRKLQWINAFAKRHLSVGELADLSKILRDLEEARIDRNFIIHGTWGMMDPQNVPACMSVKEKNPDPTEIVTETFPPERMQAIADTIRDGKFALMAWARDHAKARGKPDPYPQDKFEPSARLPEPKK